MEAQQPLAQGWAIGTLITLLPIGLFLFYKLFTAKSRRAYWMSFGFLMLLGSVLMTVLAASGLTPSREMLEQQRAQAPAPTEILSQLPLPLVVPMIIGLAMWLGGANWIMIRRRRKLGRSWSESLNPFNPPFRDMDAKT